MPNLRPLAQQSLAQLCKQLEALPSESAHAAVERLARVIEHTLFPSSDALMQAFQAARDALVEPQQKSLQAICEAFLNEANQSVNREYNAQHPLVNLPFDVMALILLSEKQIDFLHVWQVSQVSQKFYVVAHSFIAAHFPTLNYAFPPCLEETTLEGEIFYQSSNPSPYREWFILRETMSSPCSAWSLKSDAYHEKLVMGTQSRVIAATPKSDAVLMATATGFEVWDILTQQQVPCKNALFLFSLLNIQQSSKYILLLPDKKTLLHVDQFNVVYLNALDRTSLPFSLDLLADSSDPVSYTIKDFAVTLDGQYLVAVHSCLSQGLSVWRLDTKTLHQRLLLSDGVAKEKEGGFRVFTVSRRDGWVAMIYERKNWRGNWQNFCVQWKINATPSQKGRAIHLRASEQQLFVKAITYTSDGSHLVGLFGDLYSEKSDVKIKIWNATHGQCVYQHTLSHFNAREIALSISSWGEIILTRKQNHFIRLKFPALSIDTRVFEQIYKIPKKTENNDWIDDWRGRLFIFSMMGLVASLILSYLNTLSPLPFLFPLIHPTLMLEDAVFMFTTTTIFLGIGCLFGMAIVLLASVMNHSVADDENQKVLDTISTKQLENKPVIPDDPTKVIGAYFGEFFKAKPEVVVPQVKPIMQNNQVDLVKTMKG